jgi:5-dehydro-2-deoxygluconokinase
MTDVVVLGRVCIDLYPQQVGVPIADVTSFSKSIGGSATNVAVAVARHGHDVALVTRTGADSFGEYAVRQLDRFGVDTRWIAPVEGVQSVLSFCEMFPPDHFPLTIYRNPTAPDMFLETDDLPIAEISSVPILFVTATGLSREPSRAAHLEALRARARARHTILDLDYRATFWTDEHTATEAVGEALEHATVAVGNLEECRVAVGETEPIRAADALLERGIELAIVKMGPAGVLLSTRTRRVQAYPLRVDVVNGLGSGDAFAGALCHGLLQDWDLEPLAYFANAAGALLATRFECSSAMPTTDELEQFMREHEVKAG